MSFRLSFVAVAAAALFGATAAQAAPCSIDGSIAGRLGNASTDDFTLNGNGSNLCHIYDGNSGEGSDITGTGTAVGNFFPDATLTPNDDFARIAKFGESNGSVGGLDFTLTSLDSSGTSGTWELSWTGGPATLDLVLGIHAGGASGFFLFDDVALVKDSSGSGTWKIEWKANANPNSGSPGFSNMTLWARQGTPTVEFNVPEPGGLALLGLGGLLAAAALRRRSMRA